MSSDSASPVEDPVTAIVAGTLLATAFSIFFPLFEAVFQLFVVLAGLVQEYATPTAIYGYAPAVVFLLLLLALYNVAVSRTRVGPVIIPFERLADALISFFDALSDRALSPLRNSDGGEQQPIEAIHREYREGEIGDVELEKRLDETLSEQEDVEPAVEVEHAE